MRQLRLLDWPSIRIGLALGIVGGAVLSPRETRADDLAEATVLPVRAQDRPLTLPGGTLRVDGDFGVTRLDLDVGGHETWVGMGVGAAFGLSDDLMVFADVLPLRLSPELDYGDPDIGAVFRFVRGSVEIGAGLAIGFYDAGEAGRKLDFGFGIPVLARIGPFVRLETGLYLDIFAVDDFFLDFLIPVALALQATDDLFIGLRTGFGWHDLLLADTPYSPLGAFVGYTVAGSNDRPRVDLIASFDFPFMFAWGSDYGQTTVTELWAVGLGVRLFVDLSGGPEPAPSIPPPAR